MPEMTYAEASEAARTFETEMRAKGRLNEPGPALVPADDPGEPTRRSSSAPIVDWLSGAHASRLADMIVAYWAERGGAVRVSVVPIEGHVALYAITSDLVAGLPRR